MYRQSLIHRSDDLRVLDVRCSASPGDVAEEEGSDFEVVLPVAGVFSRQAGGSTAVMDAAVGYASGPGVTQHIRHSSAGDRCLAVLPGERLTDELGLDAAGLTAGWALRRRRHHLAALAEAWMLSRRADPLAAEQAWMLLLAPLLPGHAASWTSRTAVAQRRAVDLVREAIAADPGQRWTLRSLSDVAGYAPHHLSRLFPLHAGMSLTDYRDRVRLTQALALLADGATVATVAARMGFADQGHLTRRARPQLGVVPSVIGRDSR